MSEKNKDCGNCVFGKKENKPSFAEKTVECHRFPPKQDETTNHSGPYPWPVLKVGEWCGEHKTK